MSLENNKAIARRFVQAWNAGRSDVVDALASPDLVVSYAHFAEPLRGPDAFKEALEQTHRSFPDIAIEVDDLMAEGDKVMVSWTYRASHREGELFGVQPRGAKVTVQGITIYRIADGKVVEERGVVDNLGMLFQLGAFSP